MLLEHHKVGKSVVVLNYNENSNRFEVYDSQNIGLKAEFELESEARIALNTLIDTVKK